MARRPDRAVIGSKAAGLSGGTGFAGLVLLLPDGIWKSILLILAPTITVTISSSWHVVTDEINAAVADWRIKNEIKRAERVLKTVNDPELKSQAQKMIDALTLLRVEITKKRVSVLVDS
jgi:hypothetical protein